MCYHINMIKYSIRLLLNKKIRAIWDDENSKWWYSAVDVIFALTDSTNPRIYVCLKDIHLDICSNF